MKNSKATKKVRTAGAKISDAGRVRLGNFSPAFPVSAPTKKVSDSGKVRLGNFSPAF